MSYKLHCIKDGNFRTMKALIAAEYNEITLDVVEPTKTSPLGRLPALETPSGDVIFGSNAVARTVARLRSDTGLYGSNFAESGLVDSWVDFAANEIEVAASIVTYPLINNAAFSEAAVAKATDDLNKALAVLNSHLQENTYMVGHRATLADIALASALFYPYKLVLGPSSQKRFGNVTRWFVTVVNQSAFKEVIGETELCAIESAKKGGAGAAQAPKDKAPKAEKPKAEAKPKEEKKPKKKDDDDEEPEDDVPKEKKEDHPFKIMDKEKPTTFVMDTWKKTYSNADDFKVAFQWFWDNFDTNGWSIWRGDYMYNEETLKLFMTSNLIGGFIQRTEEIRKWLFGCMSIRGVDKPSEMKISCYYLIRGDSIQPLIACNDDASCYKWTRVAVPASAEDKEQLYKYWVADEKDIIDGEECLVNRCYK